jgi:hypothetical protein
MAERKDLRVPRRRGRARDAADAVARLDAARAGMDDFAREIFDLWFGGRAEPDVVFEDERWRAYMSAAAALQEQILGRLTQHAQQLRMLMNTTAYARGMVNLRFQGDIAGESAECTTTGYDVLGASVASAGGCAIAGDFEAAHTPPELGPFGPGSAAARAMAAWTAGPGPESGAYHVVYSHLVFTFCTRVDAARQWGVEDTAAFAAHDIARALGAPPPRDFVLRIRWAGEAPVRIDVPAPPVFGGPPPPRFR